MVGEGSEFGQEVGGREPTLFEKCIGFLPDIRWGCYNMWLLHCNF